MWTNTAMWLTGVSSFFVGSVSAFILCGRFCIHDDKQTEKRGVWIIEDRAANRRE